MKRGRGVLLAGSLVALPGCVSFVPLREPPPLAVELPPGNATTRDEALRSRFYLASLASSVVVDRRDNLFDARRGWLASATGEWGLQPLGSDFDYLRTMLRGSHYFTIGPVTLASNVPGSQTHDSSTAPFRAAYSRARWSGRTSSGSASVCAAASAAASADV